MEIKKTARYKSILRKTYKSSYRQNFDHFKMFIALAYSHAFAASA